MGKPYWLVTWDADGAHRYWWDANLNYSASWWIAEQRKAHRFTDRHDAYLHRDTWRDMRTNPKSVNVIRVYPKQPGEQS